MAEAVFTHVAKKHNLLDRFSKIDSAGTASYHAGSPPDSRSSDVCQANGVEISHMARQVERQDFYEFDYILAMDEYNLRDLKRQRPGDARGDGRVIMMFGDFEDGDVRGVTVEDPYYGGKKGFQVNFEQCRRYSENFMRRVLNVDI
ncbi:hypothetical protein AA313_de0210234 [Arthrobotrys entomopaga]|nr:hypothetical protein AA313_de0210234 [Arthrobotrys entomopaga]